MKKYLVIIMVLLTGSSFAKHYFNICYYNWTNHPIGYNNGINDKTSNKVSKDNFKYRGSMVGSGEIAAGQNKCFNSTDETIFLTHRLSFVVDNQLLSVVDPAFSKPYVVSQTAIAKSSGRLLNKVDGNGHDQYYLNVHVMEDGKLVLSGDADPKKTSAYIQPAKK